MLEAGMALAGRGTTYEIVKQLGRGGHAQVFQAYDTVNRRNCAIKAIDISKDSRLCAFARREAEIVRKLGYPYFPEIYEILETEAADYLVMEYLPGETAGARLRRLGPLPAGEVARLGRELCLMLSYLHRQEPPMVYCDMKPDNIMLQPEGNLRLIDFGALRSMREDEAQWPMSGTRGYAAPEQLEGRKLADARMDIYGLGVTMHQLLTGEDPCQPGVKGMERRDRGKAMPRRLARVICRCTALDPGKRYPSCEELRRDLEKVLKVCHRGGW